MDRPVCVCAIAIALLAAASGAGAQDGEWMLMQDGILFAEYNHQGGPRGGDEFVVPNWWMGMASRAVGSGRLTFTGMLSLDAATVGEAGYGELFQAGEALNGHPIVDRQHPHDLFMQLAAVWRTPLTDATGFTIAGGPVGEPALGPVAFMHRASAIDNPTAPLSHHTFDSTHIAFGVVTAALDHGPFVVEGSIFNGREPDDNRWDFDFGPLDSYSARLWYRPSTEWEFQTSVGKLTSPEELEPGQNVVRATASGSWTRRRGSDVASVSVGVGFNDTAHGTRGAVFAEGARHAGLNTLYGRFEVVQNEDIDHAVAALTFGAVHDVWRWRGFEGGVGGDVTLYGVPEALQSSYSSQPVSFHVFFRLRPPAGHMGRMLNMRMSQPLG